MILTRRRRWRSRRGESQRRGATSPTQSQEESENLLQSQDPLEEPEDEANKTEVEGEGEGAPDTSDDIFSTDILEEEEEYEYDHVVRSLLSLRTNQTFATTRETDPRAFKLTFRKVLGWTEAAAHQPAPDQQYLLSYKRLLVDFTSI